MLDARFYDLLGPVAVDQLTLGRALHGSPQARVSGVARFADAGPGDLCYFDGKKEVLAAGAGIVLARTSAPGAAAWIETPEPRAHFARVAHLIARERSLVGQKDLCHPTAEFENGVLTGPGAVIGAGVRIGERTMIGANAVIGPGVAIGRNCQIGAGAVIACVLIGDGVKILPGAKIGQAGFGVAFDAEGSVDVPHFGRAIIQDGATIGANSTIDRGLFEDTIIGENVKIDNLCHVGHNCVIGRGVAMAAFAGVSGSTHIGDGVMFGGRVGVADHITVGPRAVLAAGAAVLQDVPAGETWAGYPAKPIRQWMREIAWLKRAIGKPHGPKD
jgi:UDP-3-O-[3-hydroxymyristoyl] glucosamine N-acyltransferase